MEWLWIKIGVRWFTFSRWLAKWMLALNRWSENAGGVELWRKHYKQADFGLGLCLAKDLGRSMRKAIKDTKPLTEEQITEQRRQFDTAQQGITATDYVCLRSDGGLDLYSASGTYKGIYRK